MGLKQIGVYPPLEMQKRRRLWHSLQASYPVSFHEIDGYRRPDLAALIMFGENEVIGRDGGEPGIPRFVVASSTSEIDVGARAQIDFSAVSGVDFTLRGKVLIEACGAPLPFLAEVEDSLVHASCADRPVWVSRSNENSRLDIVAQAPNELGPGEVLKDHLSRGRFLALLPLIHFLREVTRDLSWSLPPVRASLIIDDPNLHAMSYGYIDYRRIADEARRLTFHATMGMVPLDAWFFRKEVVNFFHRNRSFLSLLVHGNDHCKRELSEVTTESKAIRIAAQSLRRISAFERKTGLLVSRTMVAPHGSVSRQTARALLLTGFQAICMDRRAYPWMRRPPAEDLLAGWNVADLVAGGLPVVPRYLFPHASVDYRDRNDLILQAFLGRPLVICGHHWDFKNGYESVAQVVNLINDIGNVKWTDFDGILHSNYLLRRKGEVLHVRLFSRRIHLHVPDGVRMLVVEKGPSWEGDDRELIVLGNARASLSVQRESCTAIPIVGEQDVDLCLIHPDSLCTNDVPSPLPNPWHMARRVLCEVRDRLRPHIRHLP